MLNTCQIMQCGDIPHCKLQDGFIDLCQKQAQFFRTPINESEKSIDQLYAEKWDQKHQMQSISRKRKFNGGYIYEKFYTLPGIPVNRGNVHFDTTPKKRPDPDPKLAFARILKLRTNITIKAESKLSPKQKMIADFMEKQGFKPVIIEPEPIPEKWVPERENAYERNIVRGMTDIEDRCVYKPVEDDEPVFTPDVTKSDQVTKDRRKWEQKLIHFHDAQDSKLRNLQNMGVLI